MRFRSDAIAAAVALSTASAALTLVSCGSTAFSGDESSAGDGGTAGTSTTRTTGGSSGASSTSGTSGNASGGNAGNAQAGEGGQLGGAGGATAQGGSSAGGASGDGGTDGGQGGEAGGTTVTCDPSLAPEIDTCVIAEEYGVFVAPPGDNDEGDGSRANPFATFGKAIEVAAESGKRVYACEGDEPFAESVNIGADASGIAIFGGFDCDDWTYGAVAKTSVVSPTPLALHIVDAENVRIEGMRFEAADATLPGESSVGAFVVNSTDVVLRRVEIVAGDGVDGEDGTLEEFEYPAQETLNGNAEEPAGMGGEFKTCGCQGNATTTGGIGGAPSPSGQAGGGGSPANASGNDAAGGGGTPGACGSGGGGYDGAPAPSAAPAAGASTFGTTSVAGWRPQRGTDGEVGQPGQGGGGGASRNTLGHGGGGGCGGCGGNGATKGFGGGASIALLAHQSEVAVDNSTLTTANGGKGGNGVQGQAGQQDVGAGGNAVSALNACPGGNGGRGGNGAASGGGAGGISVGIVWFGEQVPAQSEVTFVIGTAGDRGLGGESGVNDGIDGLAQDVIEVQ